MFNNVKIADNKENEKYREIYKGKNISQNNFRKIDLRFRIACGKLVFDAGRSLVADNEGYKHSDHQRAEHKTKLVKFGCLVGAPGKKRGKNNRKR